MTNKKYILNPKIELTELNNKIYQIRLMDNLKAHKISAELAENLMSLSGEFEETQVENSSSKTIEYLVNNNYLVPVKHNQTSKSLDKGLGHFSKNNWDEAYRYHCTTFGYPFERYNEDGTSVIDAGRMKGYVEQQIDANRGKQTIDKATRICPLPPITKSLDILEQAEALGVQEYTKTLNDESVILRALIAFVTMPVKSAQMPWKNSKPVLRKVNPSGGSRHPSEIYVNTNRVIGDLNAGWHHADSINATLNNFQAVQYDNTGNPQPENNEVTILITSETSRNRFRYREPRTFRTIHMDVGHILGSIEAISWVLNIPTQVNLNIDELKFSKELQFTVPKEIPIATITLDISEIFKKKDA